MNVTSKMRAQRIISVKKIINEASRNGKKVSYEKLVSSLMGDYYLARRTAKEYIDHLVVTTFCIKDGDDLFLDEQDIIDQALI